MIKLDKLNKYYFKHKSNEIHVLDDVSLEFADVGFTTILGPSGSGKSTLLHVIGGLDRASGSITYDDIKFNKLCDRKMDLYRNEKIGYIFQNYHLLPDLTVYQNLKIQLELIGIKNQDEIDKRIDLCLKVVGMDKYKRRNVTALSGGQQQRVAIARALVKGAKVIIADEPTGNLDSKNSIEVMNILKSLSEKCLIILVTHDQALASHYSDRIIRIKDGHIISDETNNNDNTYLTSNKGKIYLDQLQEEIICDNNHKISLFSNEKENINIKVVIVNDEIYIEELSGRSVKVVGQNTDMVFVKTTPKEENKVVKVNEDFIFDKPKPSSLKDKFVNIFNVIKSSFLSFMFAKKRTKIVHFCFLFIGILLCFCLSSLKYSTAIDESVLNDYIGSAVRVSAKNATIDSKYGYTFEYGEVKQIIEEDNGAIGLVDPLNEAIIRYRYISNRIISFNCGEKCFAATSYLLNNDIKLKGKEIALSRVLAQELINYLDPFGVKSEQDLFDGEFEGFFTGVYDGDFVIKEVFDYPSRVIMFSDELYLSLYTTTAAQGFSYRYLEEGEVLPDFEPVEPSKPYLMDVYMSSNLKNYVKESSLFEVAGYFSSSDFEVVFLNKADYDTFVYNMVASSGMNVMPYESFSYELVEGDLPVNDNEIIIPDAIKKLFPIGSNYHASGSKGISYKYTVTGYFKTEYAVNSSYVFANTKTAYLRSMIEPYDKASYNLYQVLDFHTTDPEKLIARFEEMGYDADLVRDIVITESSSLKIDESKLTIIISITIFIVMIIFIFFISRSKMLSSIYNIGVYRALGSMKKRIYVKYFFDSLVLTTFTVVLGYMIMYAFVCYADDYLYGLSISLSELLISIGSIYILMTIASLLPVVTLLKKTPIEIIGKYDI